MSETPHITVLVGYQGEAEPPGFHANMPLLGGTVLAVQFNDAFAELEGLNDANAELNEQIERLKACVEEANAGRPLGPISGATTLVQQARSILALKGVIQKSGEALRAIPPGNPQAAADILVRTTAAAVQEAQTQARVLLGQGEQRMVARLAPYLSHGPNCKHGKPGTVCTCGLAEAMHAEIP